MVHNYAVESKKSTAQLDRKSLECTDRKGWLLVSGVQVAIDSKSFQIRDSSARQHYYPDMIGVATTMN